MLVLGTFGLCAFVLAVMFLGRMYSTYRIKRTIRVIEETEKGLLSYINLCKVDDPPRGWIEVDKITRSMRGPYRIKRGM